MIRHLTSHKSLITSAGSLALLASLTACGSSSASKSAAPAATAPTAPASTAAAVPAAAVTGTIEATDQKGTGKTLMVSAVDLEGIDGGWIAIHKDLNGKPGPIAGLVHITKGKHTNVAVPFTATATTGAYWPMLHVDDHTIGAYEFPKVPGADLPVKSGSDIVMKKITVAVG